MSQLVNINLETGIRYGVIPMHHVSQAWCDSSEPVYGDCDCGDDCMCEPLGFEYAGDGYNAICDDMGDIFVTESPYYTLAPLCSPCAPNAAYLPSANESGFKAYCFGHDWFDDGVAPYPVYSVETGQPVVAVAR